MLARNFRSLPPPSRYRLLIVVEQSTARYSKRKFRVIATKRRRKRSKNKQVKPCLRSCSRLSIPNNTFPPSSFDSLQGTKWRVFRHDFPTVNTHPSSLLIPFHKFSRKRRNNATRRTRSRGKWEEADNEAADNRRRKQPSCFKKLRNPRDSPQLLFLPFPFLSSSFFFFERKRVWKIRRRGFFYLFRKGRRDKENY